MGSAGYLADISATLLGLAEDALSVARTGRALPDRRYRSHGEPVWDCDQLAVWHDPVRHRMQTGRGGSQSRVHWQVQTDWWVMILRCCPAFDAADLPSPTQLSADAAALDTDLWCLATGLYTSVPAEFGCAPLAWLDAVALGPEGNLAGWRFGFTLGLNDSGP